MVSHSSFQFFSKSKISIFPFFNCFFILVEILTSNSQHRKAFNRRGMWSCSRAIMGSVIPFLEKSFPSYFPNHCLATANKLRHGRTSLRIHPRKF
jgi:hypothetical protein